MADSNVEAVKRKLDQRALRGLEKYGVTTDRDDLDEIAWLRHLQEEMLDGAVYLQRIIDDREKARIPNLGKVS